MNGSPRLTPPGILGPLRLSVGSLWKGLSLSGVFSGLEPIFPRFGSWDLPSASHPHTPHICAQPGLVYVEIARLSGLCAYLLGCTSRANLCSQDSFLKGAHPLSGPSHVYALSASKYADETPSVMFWGHYISQHWSLSF